MISGLTSSGGWRCGPDRRSASNAYRWHHGWCGHCWRFIRAYAVRLYTNIGAYDDRVALHQGERHPPYVRLSACPLPTSAGPSASPGRTPSAPTSTLVPTMTVSHCTRAISNNLSFRMVRWEQQPADVGSGQADYYPASQHKVMLNLVR